MLVLLGWRYSGGAGQPGGSNRARRVSEASRASDTMWTGWSERIDSTSGGRCFGGNTMLNNLLQSVFLFDKIPIKFPSYILCMILFH